MAGSLKLLPEELKIYGIEPDSIQFEEQLSPAMAEALESVVAEVQNELQKVGGIPQN
jgi:coenzyme F420-reducing hydrogenase delta subunit